MVDNHRKLSENNTNVAETSLKPWTRKTPCCQLRQAEPLRGKKNDASGALFSDRARLDFLHLKSTARRAKFCVLGWGVAPTATGNIRSWRNAMQMENEN
jgi:hypothetical protein